MGSVLAVIWQAIVCPVTTLSILSIAWVWVKIFLQEWDPRHFTLSYADCIQRKQYWRPLSAAFSHSSFILLLFNASSLWNLRHIELRYGTLFYLRYTVLLCLAECALTFLLVHFTMRLAFTPVVRQTLSNLSTMGSSGLILAWVAFQSIVYNPNETGHYFVLLGVFDIHPTVAPLVLVVIYYMFLPHTHALSNLTGLTSGYLLAGGFLQVLPGFYWSFCFLLNVAIVVTVSVIYREANASITTEGGSEEGNILPVVEIGPLPRLHGGSEPLTNDDLRDLLPSSYRSNNPSPVGTEMSRMEEGELEMNDDTEAESVPLLGSSTRTETSNAQPGVLSRLASRLTSSGNATSGGYLSHLLDSSDSGSTRQHPASPSRQNPGRSAESSNTEQSNV